MIQVKNVGTNLITLHFFRCNIYNSIVVEFLAGFTDIFE
jgi:hypothetical protein